MPSFAVTGTSRGLGLGFIKALSADPANTVFALTRSKSGSKDLADVAARSAHKNVHVLEAVGTNVKSLEDAVKEITNITGGTLDVLISNAALMFHERGFLTLDAFPSQDILDEDLTDYFKTNVLGFIHTVNAFLPLLKAGSTKKCMVISTPLGSPKATFEGKFTAFAGYGISKGALNVATAKYAAQFKDDGIIFLSINPGFVRTMQGPEEEVNAFYERQTANLRSLYPDFEGAITIEESVRDQVALFSRVTIADTGLFYNRDGKVGGGSP